MWESFSAVMGNWRKKMNRRRIKATILLAMLIAAGMLCGCRLADETMQADSAEDHACGVYVIRRSQQEALQQKMYDAQGDFIKLYAHKMGTDDGTEFDFQDLGGEYLLLQTVDGGTGVTKSGAIADGQLRVEGNEQTGAETLEEQKDVVSGSIHFVKGSESEFLCYFIRKDNKGYYLGEQASAGINASSGAGVSGETSWTVAENTKRITKTFAYEVNFEEEETVKRVAAKEMDSGDRVVKTTEIHFKNGTYQLNLRPQTQYVIVEETTVDPKGAETKHHSVYDWNEIKEEGLTHYSYVSDKPGILRPQELLFTK